MKKYYSLLLGGLLAIAGIAPPQAQAAKTVPYSSPITLSSSTFDEGWTATDLDGDGYTWEPYSTSATSIGGTSSCAATKGNTGRTKDDWLFSPAIQLEAGKEYKVFYGIKAESSSHPQNMDVYFATSNDPTVLKTKTPLDRYENYTNTNFVKVDKTFNCTESGEYYLSFNCKSISDNWYMMVAVAEVYENVFTPASVTNFKAERDNSKPRVVEVNLSWTLPTKSVFGDTFTDAQTIEHVYIYRDGAETPTFTLDGTATTFTDNAEKGLTAGVHTYEIEVEVAGAKSGRVSATTKYVGPVTPATIPHTWTPSTQDDFEDWIVLKGENATTTEVWNWYSYYGVARFYHYANKIEEDYVVAPPFNVEEAGYYKVTVDAALLNVNYNSTNIFKVVYGTTPTVEGLSNVACEKIDFTSSSRTPYSYIVKLDNPGTYYFGVEAASTNAQATNTYVYAITLEESEKTPAAVSNLTATPDPEFGLSVTLNWTCPDKSSNGEDLTSDEYSIKVYKGDALVTTLDGGVNTYTDNVAEPGVYTYSVETVAPGGSSVGKQTVTSRWVGEHLVDLPYSTTFSTSDNTSTIWDIIDANNDGKTWHYYSNSYRCTQSDVEGTAANTRQYNDYFLSPWFEMTPGYYEVKFRAIGGTTSAPMTHNVGIVEAGTFVAGRSNLEQQKQYTSDSQNSSSDTYNPLKSYIFKIEEAGQYQIVFAAIGDQPVVTGSDLDYAGYGVSNVSIAAYPVLPGVATELNVTAAENEVLEATVTWKNPNTTNVEGLALESITKAVILRDGQKVTEITEDLTPGETSTFVDNSETGLTGGPHTYSVEIYNASGKSATAAPTFKLDWVGGGLDMSSPVVHTYAEFEELWSFVDVHNNQNSSYDGWSISGTTAMKVDESNSNNLFDDWAVSPRFTIENGGEYELRFETYIGATYKDYAPYSFDVYVGTGDVTEEGNFQKIGTITTTNPNSTASAPEYHSICIKGSDVAAALEGEDGVLVNVPTGSLSFALRATNKGGVFVKTFTAKPYVAPISLETPYINNFSDDNCFYGYTITTTNNKAWAKGEGDFAILDATENVSGGSMSNLATPGFAMLEGRKYVVSFKVWDTEGTSNNVTLRYANNPEFAGVQQKPMAMLAADNTSYENAYEYKALLEGTSDNVMYLRIDGIAQNGYAIMLTDLKVEEYVAPGPISLVTPYTNAFNGEFDINEYTLTPATGGWTVNANGYLTYGPSTAGTATIVSPAFIMVEGKEYKVSFDMWRSGGANHSITLKYGSDPANLTTGETYVLEESYSQATPYRFEQVITGNSEGIMYLAFDGYCNGRSSLCMDNLRVEDLAPEPPAEGNVYVGSVKGIDEIIETSSEYPYQLNYTITYNEDHTLTIEAAFNWEDGEPVGLTGNITAYIPNGNISIVLDEETGIGTSTETFNAGDVVEFTFWQARAYGRAEAPVTYTVGRPFDIQQADDADDSQVTNVDNAARTITLSKKSDVDAKLYIAAPTGATVYYLATPVSAQGVNGRREAADYVVAENNIIDLSTGTGTLSLYYQLGNEESTPIVFNYVVTNRMAVGVDGIYDTEEGARYFDLNGFEVKNPQAGQILIKVINGQATKVLVK